MHMIYKHNNAQQCSNYSGRGRDGPVPLVLQQPPWDSGGLMALQWVYPIFLRFREKWDWRGPCLGPFVLFLYSSCIKIFVFTTAHNHI